jgi:hemerythrin
MSILITKMDFLEWNESFSVGIGSIDEEHKRLIALINRLYEGIKENKQEQVLGPIFNELGDYTRSHFAHEEEIFARYGYPEDQEHALQHALLVGELQDLKAGSRANASLLSLKMMEFLRDWLGVHILEEDKAYSAFLKERGVD